MTEILKHKTTGALVSVDDDVQRDMALLQGHRRLSADEQADVDRSTVSASGTTAVDAAAPNDGTAAGPPPRTGTGSGRPAWSEYAAANHVKVPESASRDEIIELVAAGGVRTE